jgi:putative transposase
VASLGDINATLRAFLDRRYHPAPHAGLLGKSPGKVYAARPTGEGAVDEKALRAALTERTRRRVSGDNIVSVDGVVWQLDQGYLAGQVVSVARCFVAPSEPPWVEHEGKRLLLHPVDPQRNARRKRPPCGGPAADKPTRPVDFNPARTLGRTTGGGEDTSAGGGEA